MASLTSSIFGLLLLVDVGRFWDPKPQKPIFLRIDVLQTTETLYDLATRKVLLEYHPGLIIFKRVLKIFIFTSFCLNRV